jgi:hypothetical protein
MNVKIMPNTQCVPAVTVLLLTIRNLVGNRA